MPLVKRSAIGAGILVVLAGAAAVGFIGPRKLIGMLRYDRRREGRLHV